MSSSPRVRERDLADEHDSERSSKRAKLNDENSPTSVVEPATGPSVQTPSNDQKLVKEESLLPPSHVLLGTTPPLTSEDGAMLRIMETDVGISEYIAKDVPKIEGIIKQRCVIPYYPVFSTLMVCTTYLQIY